MYNNAPGDLQNRSSSPVRRLPRGPLVLVLCAILGFTGAITYTAYVTFTNEQPITALQTSVMHATPTPKQPVSREKASPKVQVTPKTVVSASHPPIATSTPTFSSLPLSSHPIYFGNPAFPEVALTFDDGPNPYYTQQILSVLRQYGVKATFFDVGYLVQDYPEIVRQEYQQGHVVADHSWSHPDLTRLSLSEVHAQLTATADAIQSAIGIRPVFFRPPYGNFNAAVIQQALALNLNIVMWNDDARDWSLPGPNVIIQRAVGEAHNGSIILLHDGGGNRWQTVAALPTIISTLRARGFHLVTMQQLLRDMTDHASSAFATPTTDISRLLLLSSSSAIWKREFSY